MDKGTITEINFLSESLQETMELLIYVPAYYTPLNKYNILIASDGKDYFQLGGLSRLADKLHENGDIDNLIIIGIPYKSIEDRRRKYVPTGDQHEAYLYFLAKELIPYIEGEYSISDDPSSRCLIGDSLAATVSLLAAVKYPEVFGKVILQSPYVDDSIINIIDENNNLQHITIYHIIGKEEDSVLRTDKTIADFLSPNRKLHDFLVEKNTPMIHEEFDGNHTWKYWKPYIEKALTTLFNEN